MKIVPYLTFLLILFAVTTLATAQSDSKKKKIEEDSKAAKEDFIKADKNMSSFFSKAYGYAIFPNVGKAAVGIGGASANGTVYQQGAIIGTAKLHR